MDPLIYQFDETAQSPANLVVDEAKVIAAATGRTVVTDHGCFYAESLVVLDGGGGTLTAGVHFNVTSYDPVLTARSGFAVAAGITFPSNIPSPIVGNITISYQAVGGYEGKNSILLQNLLSAINAINSGSILWEDLANKPQYFPPQPHTHPITTGLSELELLRNRMDEIYDAIVAKRPLTKSTQYLSERMERILAIIAQQRIDINKLRIEAMPQAVEDYLDQVTASLYSIQSSLIDLTVTSSSNTNSITLIEQYILGINAQIVYLSDLVNANVIDLDRLDGIDDSLFLLDQTTQLLADSLANGLAVIASHELRLQVIEESGITPGSPGLVRRSVDVRQTVLSGSVDSDGLANWLYSDGIGLDLEVHPDVTPSNPVVITWADGFDEQGNIDYVASIDSISYNIDESVYDTGYLYMELNPLTGDATVGQTESRPMYSIVRPSVGSVSEGQYWYPTDHRSRGQVKQGGAWVDVLWVFIGSYDTTAGDIDITGNDALHAFGYQGKAMIRSTSTFDTDSGSNDFLYQARDWLGLTGITKDVTVFFEVATSATGLSVGEIYNMNLQNNFNDTSDNPGMTFSVRQANEVTYVSKATTWAGRIPMSDSGTLGTSTDVYILTRISRNF